MILARLLGKTLYAGRDRFRRPFVAIAQTALHPDCVSGPELRATWANDSLFQVWCWGVSLGRVTVEYI